MRLFELVDDSPGTYVAAQFSDETLDNLKKFQDDNNIPSPVPVDDLHCTIVYSRVEIDDMDYVESDENTATAKGFTVWETKSDTKCLVLLLESEYLQERFDLAMELGATYDFDDYKPHITLSYDVGEFDTSALTVPTFGIQIVNEYREALD